MKKSALVMLILALVFTGLTTLMLIFTSFFLYGTLKALYNPDPNVGDVIGGIFLFFITFGYSVGTICCAVPIIPFSMIHAKKMGKKGWYSWLFLAFAILAIMFAVVSLFAIPIIDSTVSSQRSGSSR